MGGCCSCHVSFVGKVHDVESECNHNNDDGACEHGRARVMLKGSSTFVSMYSQKGSKGVNQDALKVWQVRLILHSSVCRWIWFIFYFLLHCALDMCFSLLIKKSFLSLN